MRLSACTAGASPQSGLGVFAVPVRDAWLLHAPLHEQSALLNSPALERIAACEDSGSGALLAIRRALNKAVQPPQPRQGPLCPLFLCLLPTRACNLRCSYCGFGAAACNEPAMNAGEAARAVDWMARQVRDRGGETLDIHLFGGEPLHAPDVVEVVVHRTRAAAAEMRLTPHLQVITNGVCSEQRARWVGDYFDVVVLSFDGPRDIYDRQRGCCDGRPAFDAAVRTAAILSRSSADLYFRVCVTDYSVGTLAAATSWFCEQFQPHTIDLEPLKPTPESSAAGLGPPDPYEFAREFWRARRAALPFGTECHYSAALSGPPRLSFCPVGSDALILSPGGSVDACYLLEQEWGASGLDMHLGSWDGSVMRISQHAVERVRRIPSGTARCLNCFCRWSCAGGCHVVHKGSGAGAGFDDFCVQTRLISALLLLDEMGAADRAEDLLTDEGALKRLAMHSDDRLPREGGAHA
ncbi:MAG: radical SAM protein [Bryobacterales bacterium]|nr:radical SAM protein [Bryobacterales bacterium]